jgi:hypothetical protein
MKELEQFLQRAESVLARVEAMLPAAAPEIDWSATAFRWRVGRDQRGHLNAVAHPSRIRLEDLHKIAPQKEQIEQNTPYWIVESGFSAGLRFPGFKINAFLTQATPGNTEVLFSDSAIGVSANLLIQELFRRRSK